MNISKYIIIRANGATVAAATSVQELIEACTPYINPDDIASTQVLQYIGTAVFATTPQTDAHRERILRNAITGEYRTIKHDPGDGTDIMPEEDVVADIYRAAFTGEANVLARLNLVRHRETTAVTLSRHADDKALPLNVAMELATLTSGEAQDGHGKHIWTAAGEGFGKAVPVESEDLLMNINGGTMVPVTSAEDIVANVCEYMQVRPTKELERLVGLLWTQAKQMERGRYYSASWRLYRSPDGLPYTLNDGRGRTINMYQFGRIFGALFSGYEGALFSFNAAAMYRGADRCQVFVAREANDRKRDPHHICQPWVALSEEPARDEFYMMPVVMADGSTVPMVVEHEGWGVTAQVCTYDNPETYRLRLQTAIDRASTLVMDLGEEYRTFLLYSTCTPDEKPTTATANAHKQRIKMALQRAAHWLTLYTKL